MAFQVGEYDVLVHALEEDVTSRVFERGSGLPRGERVCVSSASD
jgi:hypothetical protein